MSSPEFAFWVMLFKAAFCGLAMLLLRKKLFPSLKKGDDSKRSYSFEKPYSAEKSAFSTELPSSGQLEACDCEKTTGRSPCLLYRHAVISVKRTIDRK